MVALMRKLLFLFTIVVAGCIREEAIDVNIVMINEADTNRHCRLKQEKENILFITKGMNRDSNASCLIRPSMPLILNVDGQTQCIIIPKYRGWYLNKITIYIRSNHIVCEYLFHDKNLEGDEWENWWNTVQIKKIINKYDINFEKDMPR